MTMTRRLSGFIALMAFLLVALLLPVLALGAADVTVQWDPNSEVDLAGYKLHYKVIQGTSGGGGPPYSDTVDVGNVTEYTLLNLPDDNVVVYITATAYNTSGLESGYSNEVFAVFSVVVISDLRIATQVGSQVDLQWTPSSSPLVDHQELYKAATPGGYGPDVFATIPAGIGEISVGNLAVGPTYFAVVSVFASGPPSERSNEVVVYYNTEPPAPPSGCSIKSILRR